MAQLYRLRTLQNFVRLLSQARRRAAQPPRRVAESGRDHRIAGAQPEMRRGFGHVSHGRHAAIRRPQALEPVFRRARAEDARQLGGNLLPARTFGELIRNELLATYRAAKRLPELRLQCADRDAASVRRLIDPITCVAAREY